jgi:hypothetical protein
MSAPLRRRRFLQVLGASALLAACGDDGNGSDAGPGSMRSTGGDGGSDDGSLLVALFSTDRVVAAGTAQRLPMAVFAQDRRPRRDAGLPATAEISITRDGSPVQTVPVERHGQDLPFPYYPLRTTLPEPGLYDLTLQLDDGPATMTVQAFDPAQVTVPQPGQPMPSAPTPTTGDPRGVDPICTRAQPCPFHGISLDQALTTGPVVVLVGTPAYCQTGICGPVLEQLVAAAPRHPALQVIHAEVWANPRQVGGNIADPGIRPAPVIAALRLDFEPVLFVVGSDGTISDRLDNVFDQDELESVLQGVA